MMMVCGVVLPVFTKSKNFARSVGSLFPQSLSFIIVFNSNERSG